MLEYLFEMLLMDLQFFIQTIEALNRTLPCLNALFSLNLHSSSETFPSLLRTPPFLATFDLKQQLFKSKIFLLSIAPPFPMAELYKKLQSVSFKFPQLPIAPPLSEFAMFLLKLHFFASRVPSFLRAPP